MPSGAHGVPGRIAFGVPGGYPLHPKWPIPPGGTCTLVPLGPGSSPWTFGANFRILGVVSLLTETGLFVPSFGWFVTLGEYCALCRDLLGFAVS